MDPLIAVREIQATESRESGERRLGRWLDRLVAVGFVVVLAVPSLLLVAGVRPVSIENRDPAVFPRISLRGLTDPAFYAGIDRFLVDNLPLRNEAVEAHAAVDNRVLGGTSNPDVVVGVGDWLFNRGEMQPRCDFTAGQVLDKVDRAAAQLKATGRAFRYIVAPDKHTVYPDKLPPDSPFGTPCSDQSRATLRAGLVARPGYAVDAWTPVLAARAADPTKPLYYVLDDHWTPLGATLAIKALVQSLAPGVWNDREVTIDGTQQHTGDMSTLMGLPRDETIPKVVMRPGLNVDRRIVDTGIHIQQSRDIPWFTVNGNRPVVPGRTLIVYDSFFGTVINQASPWFEESVWVHEGDLFNHPELADVLPAFDTVVFERVERSAYFTDPASDLATIIAKPKR